MQAVKIEGKVNYMFSLTSEIIPGGGGEGSTFMLCSLYPWGKCCPYQEPNHVFSEVQPIAQSLCELKDKCILYCSRKTRREEIFLGSQDDFKRKHWSWSYFLAEINKCTLAKMFSYTVLFITPTCFGHFFWPSWACRTVRVQAVGQWLHKMRERNLPRSL